MRRPYNLFEYTRRVIGVRDLGGRGRKMGGYMKHEYPFEDGLMLGISAVEIMPHGDLNN